MKTVFVASSRRFYDIVFRIKEQLDELGIGGYYPYIDKTDVEKNPKEKKKATLQHFPEIDEIDVLYVVAKDGYVGFSVAIEIAYAYAKGKEIISSEQTKELAVSALVSRVMSPEKFIEYVSA